MREKCYVDAESARTSRWDEIPAKDLRIYGYTVDEVAQIIGSLKQAKYEAICAFVKRVSKTADSWPLDYDAADLWEGLYTELAAMRQADGLK